jgi:hypothetical protein
LPCHAAQVEYTRKALKPSKTAVGESHHESRLDVCPNLPFFQMTSGAAILSSAVEDRRSPLAADGRGLYIRKNAAAKRALKQREFGCVEFCGSVREPQISPLRFSPQQQSSTPAASLLGTPGCRGPRFASVETTILSHGGHVPILARC